MCKKESTNGNSLRCKFGIHKWTKWEQYIQPIMTKFGEGIDKRQKRRCVRCNKAEDIYVN